MDSALENEPAVAPAQPEPVDRDAIRSPAVASRTLHATGHVHLDPVWLWDKSDGFERFRAAARSILSLMDRNHDMCVAVSSAALYDYLRKVDGELFEQIVARVSEGRWEPVGGMWIEPDEHVPGGEGYIRQLLLGQEFYTRYLGRPARIAWSPDSFGRFGQLPRMLAGSGLEGFIFKRPERDQKSLPDVFWWTATDGSRILASHVREYGTWGTSLSRLVESVARDLREPIRHGLVLYGVGNHGGGPTQANIDALRQLQLDPRLPPIVFSTAESYFRELLDSNAEFPVVEDNLEAFIGSGYSTFARLKGAFRQTESELLTAESLAGMRSIVDGSAYPTAEFSRAWERVAFNHFHDIAAGTSIPDAYPTVLDELAEARSIAREITLESTHAVANRIEIPFGGGEQPLVVFNPNGHEVRQLVIANVQAGELPGGYEDASISHMLVDEDGAEIPMQRVRVPAMPINRLGFILSVPPLGYRVLRLVPKPQEYVPPELDALSVADLALENDRYRLEIDEATGVIARLYDRVHGLEVFSGLAAAPLLVRDSGNAWGDRRYEDVIPDAAFRPISFRRAQEGPLLSSVEVRYALERDGATTATTLLQEFRLYRDLPYVDVHVRLHWQEDGVALKLVFPVFIHKYPEYTAEMPYASTMYPADGVEVPGQSWVDVTGETNFTEAGVKVWHGLTIANTAKYSYSFRGHGGRDQGTVAMMIARGNPYTYMAPPGAVEPPPIYLLEDEGTQEFVYSLIPHFGGWREMLTARRAIELNRPLLVMTESAHAGKQPSIDSLLSISAPNILLGAVKGAESSDGLIARFYEAHGEETDSVRIDCCGHRIQTDFRAGEIKTFRLPADGGPVSEVNLLEQD